MENIELVVMNAIILSLAIVHIVSHVYVSYCKNKNK